MDARSIVLGNSIYRPLLSLSCEVAGPKICHWLHVCKKEKRVQVYNKVINILVLIITRGTAILQCSPVTILLHLHVKIHVSLYISFMPSTIEQLNSHKLPFMQVLKKKCLKNNNNYIYIYIFFFFFD